MIFDLFGALVMDGGIAAVFNSPFIIPVAGCVMVACIVVSSIWAGVRSQEIKSHERLAKIAQGIPVEPDWDEATVRAATAAATAGSPVMPVAAARTINDGGKARRAGIVLTSIGVGLFAFFFMLTVIVREPAVMSGGAAGLIPLAIGIGFLIDARLKRRDYERHLEWERSATATASRTYGPANPAVPVGEGVPPPPPPAMSAAQASDWRPLH